MGLQHFLYKRASEESGCQTGKDLMWKALSGKVLILTKMDDKNLSNLVNSDSSKKYFTFFLKKFEKRNEKKK